MANVLYPLFKQEVLKANVDLDSNLKLALLDGDYVYSDSHQFLDDVTGITTPIDTSGNLASKTFTDGVFDADNVTFTTVTGADVEGMILYLDTGTPATSALIAFWDAASGLPLTPDGGNITTTWDAQGVFEL